MASGIDDHRDRREATRVGPEETPWDSLAVLRPGQEVVLLNLSEGGALVQSPARMRPGARAELQVFGVPRRMLRGRIGRCHIAQLDPLRYEGAIVFEERLDWNVTRAGSG